MPDDVDVNCVFDLAFNMKGCGLFADSADASSDITSSGCDIDFSTDALLVFYYYVCCAFAMVINDECCICLAGRTAGAESQLHAICPVSSCAATTSDVRTV